MENPEIVDMMKSQLEITLYKNISDALANFYVFVEKNNKAMNEEEKELYNKLRRLYRVEVANNIEYACIMYLDNKLNNNTFESYYNGYLEAWVPKLKKLRTNPEDENVFSAIIEANEKIKSKKNISNT